MRRTAGALVVFALAIGSQIPAAVLAGPAVACSCVVATDAEHAARASAVFVGVLVSRQEPGPGVSSVEPAILTFAVTGIYQGEVAARQPILTVVSGASCGLELSGPGPHLVFARQETFAAFDPPAAPGTLRADLCGGSRPLDWGVPDAGLGEPRPPVGEAGLAAAPRGPVAEDAGTAAVSGDGEWLAPAGAGTAGVVTLAAGLAFAARRRGRRA